MDRSKPDPNSWSKDWSSDSPGSGLFPDWPRARAGGGPIVDVLVELLRKAIFEYRVAPGETLPPTRQLAVELTISRGTVSEAYRRLADQGLISGSGRRGTAVLPTAMSAPSFAAPPHIGADSSAYVFARRPRTTADFEAYRALPCEIDLSPGVPDLGGFPRAAWLRAERQVLSGVDHAALGYGDPQGALALRAAVARWLARTRGIVTAPDRLVIVSGVAQALSLLAVVLRRHGRDTVAVEDPGSLGARGQLAAWGITTPPVPIDDLGLVVDQLGTPDAVMVTPAHQFPTGVVLDPTRRAALIDWARETGGLIVEDDYDAEHRYDRHPVAAIAATAPDLVYYAGSVSKTLAPAIRIGWVLPPPELLADLVSVKRDSDLGNATLPQLVLAELMSSGALESHLRRTRRHHLARRDALRAALDTHTDGCRILGAAAGIHLTVALPPGSDDERAAAACLALGVKVQPLSWHRQGDLGAAGLVLGYAAAPPARLADAAARIGRALKVAATG